MMWQNPLQFPSLKTNQIHIWRVSVKQNLEKLSCLLSYLNPEEQKRAHKFMADHARNKFIISRGVLRKLLGSYLQIDPIDIAFKQNEYGKLFLKSAPFVIDLQFNLSHSNDVILLAFVLNHQIGIDLEFIQDNFDFINIAKRFFSSKESDSLLKLPKEQQLHAFFNCWSRKEAVIKAIGSGVFFGLKKFSVEVSAKKEGHLNLYFEDKNHEPKLSLEAINPKDNYAGAFATPLKEYNTNLYLI